MLYRGLAAQVLSKNIGIVQGRVPEAFDLDMRPEANDFGFDLLTESPDDRQGKYQSTDSQCNATDGDVRDKAKKPTSFRSPLCASQIPQRDKSLESGLQRGRPNREKMIAPKTTGSGN